MSAINPEQIVEMNDAEIEATGGGFAFLIPAAIWVGKVAAAAVVSVAAVAVVDGMIDGFTDDQ